MKPVPAVRYTPGVSVAEYLDRDAADEHTVVLAAYGLHVTRSWVTRDEPFVGPTTYHVLEVER